MNKAESINRPERSPTLNTIKMVEKTLQEMDESVTSVAELKRHLPRQINHTTLKTILEYLEESNKIAISIKGITWIHNNNRDLNKAVSRGTQL